MPSSVARSSAREPKQDPIALLRSQGIVVISMTGSQYAVRVEDQDKMCLTSDMTLNISVPRNDMDVKAYLDRLKRRGVTLRALRPCSLQIIRRLYEELGDGSSQSKVISSTGGASERQIEVMRWIKDAVARGASDIHIDVHQDIGTVAFRIDGDLYRIQELPTRTCVEMCSSIYQSMCAVADSTYKPHLFQDAAMREDFVKRSGLTGSRVASGPISDGSRMVIRLLYDNRDSVPDLPQLGYLEEQIGIIESMRAQTAGINILSGATGSGKSTTLVSVLTEIIRNARASGPAGLENDEEYWGVSVVTIEDPPEYLIRGATQIPLNADKKDDQTIRLAWGKAIAAVMRQDPDIMMIGEIRDSSSASAAFDAAMTGHGVWTTVHTNDALSIMSRLAGLNVPRDRMLDPEIVTGLINQSLAQRLCPHCSIPWREGRHRVEPGLAQRVEAYCDPERVRLRGPGCEHCTHGITGRIVVAEAIMPNLHFMEALDTNGKAKAKEFWVREMGGITKCMAMIRRINEGLIDPREAEKSVLPLNKDMLTMSLDYTRSGDFRWGQAACEYVPKGQSRRPYTDFLRSPVSLSRAPARRRPVESHFAQQSTVEHLLDADSVELARLDTEDS